MCAGSNARCLGFRCNSIGNNLKQKIKRMKKIDLTQVKYLDIEGNETLLNLAKQLGNFMYMQGGNILEKELGWKAYHSADKLKDYNPESGNPLPDCSFEVNEEEEKAINKFVAQQYSYIVQEAIKNGLKAI